MPTEIATPPAATPPPAAATPPPAAPAKPAAPSTPPIPAAQAASNKQPAATAKNTSSRTPPDAPPTLDNEMRKLADEMLKPKGEAKPTEAKAPVAPEAKPTEIKPAEVTKPKDTPAPTAEEDHLGIPEPKGMSPENLGNWKSWRDTANKKIGEAKAEAAAIQSKLKTYETASPADSERATKLEARLKEVQDKLTVLSLQDSPDFIKQYVEPKKNALKEAAEIVAYNGKDTAALGDVLNLPLKEFNAAVSEITKDMNGMDATSVQAALRQAHKLSAEEKNALGNAGELKKQIESKQAAIARQAFEETRTEFSTRVPELQIPEGAPEERANEIRAYNADRAEAMKEAERFSFSKISEKDVASIAQRAAALPVLVKHIIPSLTRERDQAMALNKQLSDELAAIKKGKNPGQFTESSGGASKVDTSKMSYQELYDHMAAQKKS